MRINPMSALAIVVAGCATPSTNGPDTIALRQEVMALSDSLIAVEKLRDPVRSAAFFAEDAVIQPPGAPQMNGRAAMEQVYAHTEAQADSARSTRMAIHVARSGDLAFEWGTNHSFNSGASAPVAGKYLAVWKKYGDRWLISALSFSDDAPAPGAPGR
jgi:ketosteroid isomerase-like protein